MKVHARSTRISGFFPVGVMTILAALLVSAAPSYGVAHKYPGTPMGPNGASGVVDSATNPRDMYSVYLFRGQEVGFDPTATAGDGFLSVTLYAPGPFGAEVAGNSMFSGILYTPAVSGTYSLEVTTDGNGEAYTIDVRGAESMPLTTATALSSPSRARVNKVLTVSGTVSPGWAGRKGQDHEDASRRHHLEACRLGPRRRHCRRVLLQLHAEVQGQVAPGREVPRPHSRRHDVHSVFEPGQDRDSEVTPAVCTCAKDPFGGHVEDSEGVFARALPRR